jgi:hypothetical protein
MEPAEVLSRLAATLRREIGPAVAEPYPRTQAFMASVVVEKVARQLRLSGRHGGDDRRDREELLADLQAMLGDHPPAALRAALDNAGAEDAADGRDGAVLAAIVDALYATRDELGRERFDAALTRVRRTLRARLDRQLEYAA